MPGKEKEGKEELVMKVVHYITGLELKSLIPILSHGVKLEKHINNLVMKKGGGQSGKSQGGAGGEGLSSGRALRLPHCSTANNQNRISGFTSLKLSLTLVSHIAQTIKSILQVAMDWVSTLYCTLHSS